MVLQTEKHLVQNFLTAMEKKTYNLSRSTPLKVHPILPYLFIDFAVLEKIITKAEKSKDIQKKRCQSGHKGINLSEIVEAYKKVMRKKGIDLLNETHFYSMVIKLSLNQHGKSWRDCL